MGRVRKLWREHLGLASDEDLRSALSGFHVDSYTPPLQTLREQVNLQFRVVGLKPCTNASAFTYDGAARMLVSRKVNILTRDNFQKLCSEEGWLREDTAPAFRNLSIRSFSLLIEGIANGLYKAEVIHRRSWQSLEAVELATLEWVNWFNLRRLLEPISNIPPAEAEAAYYQQTRELAMAA